MAADEEREHTDEATTINNANAALEEDELELSLGLPLIVHRDCKKSGAELLAVEKYDLNLTGEIYDRQKIESGNFDCLGFEDTKVKREVHALRRKEARKKRGEKRRARSNGERNCGNEDRVWSDRRGFEERERDRERREKENESEFCQRIRKVNNGVDLTSSKLKLSLTRSFFGCVQGSNAAYALPCWASNGARLVVINNGNNNGFQQVGGVAGGSGGDFRPYQAERNCGGGGKDGENRQSMSNCSRGSSSGISDYQSTSGQGGSNSDAGSHSSHSQPRSSNTHTQSYPSQTEPQSNGFASNLLHPQAECNSSSCQIESTRTLKKASGSAEGPLSWNDHNHDQTKPPHEPLSSVTQVCQDKKPISQPGSPGCQPQKEVHKGDMGKPPKPPAQSSEALLLSQKPCVSATGNGPNGKTVNGLLYRYTKAEVCIVCVCHGTSFTPAGFVEHAGGVDIEHPLKHIRVVPFALG